MFLFMNLQHLMASSPDKDLWVAKVVGSHIHVFLANINDS
jgi:hypothetical protein